MSAITTLEQLDGIYGDAMPNSVAKVAHRLTPEYRAWIEASAFCALATAGPEGLDCSPRGDAGPVVTALDATTLALPDRRGNNRIDSLRNIVRDPRVALMFLYPGSGTVMRINGTARITVDPDLLDRFTIEGKPPRSVVLVRIDELYFQCAKSVMRAGLWEGGIADPATLPTPGAILKALARGDFDGETYDRDWPARAQKTLW